VDAGDDGLPGRVWRRPSLRALILAFAGVNLLFTPVFVLLPV
jgi:hypothetical protein